MRPGSYAFTFFAVTVTLILNIIASRRVDWLVFDSEEVLHARTSVYYGLTQRCELDVLDVPGRSKGGHIGYNEYTCRDFPTNGEDECEGTNKSFCNLWTVAAYSSYIAIGFGSITLLTILASGMSVAGRRSAWKLVAVLTFLHAAFQIVAFSIVTDLARTSRYAPFEYVRQGPAYIMNIISWVVGVLAVFAVIGTGVAAQEGHRWAAGSNGYTPIRN